MNKGIFTNTMRLIADLLVTIVAIAALLKAAPLTYGIVNILSALSYTTADSVDLYERFCTLPQK